MSNANFEAPKIGDGQQMGDGNVEETLNVGRSGQPVQMQPSATGKVGFYGTTPITQRTAAVATSAVGTASSADVTTTLKAAVIDIMNTLDALGLGVVKKDPLSQIYWISLNKIEICVPPVARDIFAHGPENLGRAC